MQTKTMVHWGRGWVGEGEWVNILRFVSDRWEMFGQPGGAPGSIKDYLRHEFGRTFEVFLTCYWSINIKIDLGVIRDHPVPLWDF